jgi:hypothetical protein
MSTSIERFTTNCPSCDAGVAVKAALVGKKIECPKCKFRFVVPGPAGGDPAPDADAKPAKPSKAKGEPKADDAKADPKGKGKGKGKKEKEKAKGGGNGKVIVGAIVGVVALIGLAVGAILIFGKLSQNDSAKATTPRQNTGGDSGGAGGGGGGGDGDGGRPRPDGGALGGGADAGAGPVIDDPGPQPMNPGGGRPGGGRPGVEQPGGGGDPMTPGGGQPGAGGGGNTPPPVKPNRPARTGTVDITNLLPGDTTAVFHTRLDEVDRNARTLRGMVFDKATTDLFTRSMNFKPEQVVELVQAEVGRDRAPFVVFRTKSELDETMFASPKMDTNAPEPAIQGRQYRVVNRNAFLSAAEKSLGVAGVFAPLLGIELPAPEPTKGKEVKYAIHLYDPNTLIVAEHVLMQRYLTDLKDGYPEFVTAYKEYTPPPPAAEPEGGRQPGEGGRLQPGEGGRQQPGGQPSGPPVVPPLAGAGAGAGSGAGAGAAQGGQGGQGGPAAPPKPKKPITSNPTFRTVDASLKRAMNALQDEEKDMPVAAYATRVSNASVNLLDPKSLLNPQAVATFALLQDVRLLGMSVTRLTDKRGTLSGYIEYRDSDAAKSAVDQKLIPGLTMLVAGFPAKLQPIAVTDLDDPSSQPAGGAGGVPGGYPGGYPGSPAGPGGGVAPLGPPGSPAGPGGSPLSPPRGGGGGRDAAGPSGGGSGSGDEDAQGPRGGQMQQPPRGAGGGPGGQPGSPAGPGYPGGYPGAGSGIPGGEGSGPSGPVEPSGNSIGVSRDGSVVSLAIEFNWKEDVFATTVEPLFTRQGALLRGKMGMFSGEGGVFALAARTADGKATGGLTADALGKGALPQGALPRDARTDDRRLPGSNQGLPYQPEQRCSFFTELLRYMDNKNTLYRRVDTNQAWYQGANLGVAETWVPELLVSDYPQSAWRATSDLIADGRAVGATNFVGVAGLGLDAARLNPKNPEDAKKVGMTGYEFGSKLEDVTDGLANTAYLIQVPPTYQRPWMAGGGATLMGVNDKGSDPARPFLHKKADGSRGTMVLMGDGSVRYVKEGIDPAVFRGMATRAGGEKLGELDKVAPPITNGMTGELKATK